jgi:hypothetical protein
MLVIQSKLQPFFLHYLPPHSRVHSGKSRGIPYSASRDGAPAPSRAWIFQPSLIGVDYLYVWDVLRRVEHGFPRRGLARMGRVCQLEVLAFVAGLPGYRSSTTVNF